MRAPDDARDDAHDTGGTHIRSRGRRHAIVRRTGAPRVRGVVEARAVPAVVDADVDGHDAVRSCEMDVRTGGSYRLNFGEGMDFFGTYLEVTPPSLIVWTNDEDGENGSVTTVTLTETDGDDADRRQRGVSLEGSARRRRYRRGRGDARDVRAAGRTARRARVDLTVRAASSADVSPSSARAAR